VTRRERALAIADGRTLVSADPATVSWLTGHVPDIEWGPSPFSAPPVVVVDSSGAIRLVCSEDEAAGLAPDVEPVTFPGFALEDVDRRARSTELALSLLHGRIAGELASLPGEIARAELDDVGDALQRARAVKDPDEIDAIRAAIAICDAGQAAARSALRAGGTELELWTEVRHAMETAAASRLPVLADLVTGPRTAEIGGPPTDRRIEDGDLLIVDLVPRVGAYWGDSCATIATAEPPAAAREAHGRALEALEQAKAAIRPGARAGEVDAIARSYLSFPHHTGHGIGLETHEQPRIIPGSDQALEPGMVVALEPGTYTDDWGLRVEQVVLVTGDGHELLSGHDLSLYSTT
jgi:Xaa-Pro aminopeptidase